MNQLLYHDGNEWGTFKSTTLEDKPLDIIFINKTNVPVDILKAIITSLNCNTPLELYLETDLQEEWSFIAYDDKAIITIDHLNKSNTIKYHVKLNKIQAIKQLFYQPPTTD